MLSRTHRPSGGCILTFSSRVGLVSLRNGDDVFFFKHTAYFLMRNWPFLSGWASIRGNGFVLETETVHSDYRTWLRESAGLVYLPVSRR